MQKTISLKLKMDEKTSSEFNKYFLEFGKAVNFFLRKMYEIRSSFVNIPKKIQEERTCPICDTFSFLIKKNNSSFKFNFFLNQKTINKLKEKNLAFDINRVYQILPQQNICSYCYGFVASDNFIRHQLYPERQKRIKLFANAKDSAKLSGTEFAMAFEQAKAILKSRKEQLKYLRKRITFLNYLLRKNLEVKEDRKIEVEEEIDGKKITKKVQARITIPPRTSRHKEKYRHYLDNPKYKGKTIYKIGKSIEELKGQIEKLRKRELSFPHFNNNVIQLHNNSLKFLKDNYLRISFGKNKFELEFYGTNVKNEKSAMRFKDALDNIKKHKITYSHISKRDDEFYLEYPMIIDIEIKKPDVSFNVMGIDRGIKKLLVYSIISSYDRKLMSMGFYSGEDLWKTRIKYRAIIRRLKGVRRKNRKMRIFGGKVKNINKNLVQEISRKIVNIANDNKPIIIIMEDIKGIKEPKAGNKYKKQAKLRFMLNTFNYGQIQKAIEYKANEEGISVEYIDPKHTSQQCSRCEDIRAENRKTQGYFKCKNCGYQLNADLNASINIAKKFYEKFK